MKNRLLLTFLVAIVTYGTSNAQMSNDKGVVSIYAGSELGGYITFAEATTGNFVVQDTGGAVTSLFQFQTHYGFHKRFSAGISLRSGKYLNDPDDDVDKDNRVNSFLLEARFYPLCKEKFNLFFGLGLGSTRLYYVEKPIANYKYEYFFKGFSLRTQFGLNWYFAKFMGMHFNLNLFELINFKNTRIELNDQKQNYWDTYDLNVRGGGVNIGLSFKINTAK